MANYRDPKQTLTIKTKVLYAAAKLFLQKGFSETTVKEIAQEAGVSTSTMLYIHDSKENILAALVKDILERQFAKTKELLWGVTDDRILFYAMENVLQLYIVELNEYIRDLYIAAYSMPKTTEIIQKTIADVLGYVFKDHLPHLQPKDFFELEVASCGIMRGFMSIPCDMYFTMQRKIRRFLETTLLIYRVSDEKIEETIQFISRFDFVKLAEEVIDSMLHSLGKEPDWIET